MARTVAMDTSALMSPVEHDLRLFDELDRLLGAAEYVLPRAVQSELRSLSAGGGTEGTAASVGLDLVSDRCRVLDTDESYADDAVVELACDRRADYVATNDLALCERVLDVGVPVIALRGENKLAITQP